MASKFNNIIDKQLSFTDFSLISEISDINELSFDGKDRSSNFTYKQVRFDSSTNNNPFLNSSVISDASLLESESKFLELSKSNDNEFVFPNNKNNYNSIKNQIFVKQDYITERISHPKLFINSKCEGNDKTKEVFNEDDHNDDTSIWSSGTDVSVHNIHNINNNNPVIENESLFKTIDGMSSGFSNETSSSVETVISDDVSDRDSNNLCNKVETNSLMKPVVNSSRKLEREIHSLEIDLHLRQASISQNIKELAAKRLAEQLNLKEKFNSNNSYAMVSQTPVELTQPLNVKSHEELFPDLTRLSVQDESIIVSQGKKIAAIRNRVGADKVKRKIENELPEPDVMEFFDPNKHVFKSLNLSFGSNFQQLKPSLSLANERLYSIFRNRDLLSQFQ